MYNLEDREKVRELFARFCHAIDDPARYEDWVRTYTPDGVFDSPIAGTHRGHEELRAFTKALGASAVGNVQQRHIVENLVMNLEAEKGTTECTLTVWFTKDGET